MGKGRGEFLDPSAHSGKAREAERKIWGKAGVVEKYHHRLETGRNRVQALSCATPRKVTGRSERKADKQGRRLDK